MIRCAQPEALLLVPLAVVLLRGRLWPRALVGALRVVVLVLLAGMLAGVAWHGVGDGRDVVLVVDRSASMPVEANAAARELATAIAAAQPAGDRVGVVTFAAQPVVESVPQVPFAWPDVARPHDAERSDLAGAIGAALALLPAGRPGSLLVVSDGEHNGGDLDAAARAAARAGVRIDTVLAARPVGVDTAVVDVQAPSVTPVGQPFAVAAVVATTAAGPARWQLRSDGALLDEGTTELVVGRNVLQFRPRLDGAGQRELTVVVERDGDPQPANDRATTVVQLDGPRRVLVVSPGGREDRLTAALRAAGLDVVVAAPRVAPLTLAQLDAFHAVVLQDVAAGDLPAGAMRAVATWVEQLGGGLLMTGGRSSFGIGGYHRTPIEDVLPVTMEVREEQRRFGLAMAIALDCSGSMRAEVGGVTKMELANRGAGSAIELLSAIDAVAVLAVDERARVVVPMQPVELPAELAERAREIAVGGGGIFVGPALHGAAAQLRGAVQEHKHLVLFADASDAEEPGDYRQLLPQLVAENISVSVIGLGGASDPDAELLQEIARLGGGRCQFVADASDLPRVFAQETIQVARSSLVEQATPVHVRPGLAALGELPTDVPPVGGYAMAWLRPRAEEALVTADAQAAPLLAHWHVGLGRAAAFLGEVDGELSGGLGTWPRYGGFFATLVRWLGGTPPAGVFVHAWREPGAAVWSLEVEPARAASLDGARGVLLPPGEPAQELTFTRPAPGRLLARVPLRRTGTWRAAVQIDGAPLALPPLCLSSSPEHALEVDPRAGERTLRRLALATGGAFAPSTPGIVAGERRNAGAVDLGPWLAVALLAALLAEIVVRRLRLFARAPLAATASAPSVVPAAAPSPVDPAAAAGGAGAGGDAGAGDAGVVSAFERARRRTELR